MKAGSARFGTIKAQTLSNQVELVLVFIIMRWRRSDERIFESAGNHDFSVSGDY